LPTQLNRDEKKGDAEAGWFSPRGPYRYHWALAAIILAFVAVRLPVVLQSPASQDEEWYGVPGYTVAKEGLPRVPYVRAREQGSVFFGAEQILFAQPPLGFYAQAPFFMLLPAGYAAARMASLVAACVSIVLVSVIGRRLFSDPLIALLAAAFYSLSRLLFFPAVSARPDMLCSMFGLLAIASLLCWQHQPYRAVVAAGVSLGCAGLTHPFALVFAIQIGIWTLARAGSGVERGLRCIALVTATALTFSLWVPLIVQAPDLFRAQFGENILRPAGPGLLARMIMPQASFANQIPQLYERAQPIQFLILAGGVVACLILAAKTRNRSAALLGLLAVSSSYLLVVCVGIHPIQGFWAYPAAFGWLCVAYGFHAGGQTFTRTGALNPPVHRAIQVAVYFTVLTAMIPGSGLRTTATYVRHWNEPTYDARRFVKSILDEVPHDASLTVGREFALDAYGLGREIILACQHPMYFDSTLWPTDYLILGRRDFEAGMLGGYEARGYRLQREQRFGIADDPLANYAELWKIDARDFVEEK